MRQAGRYLPEYQKLRDKHSLKELFTNSDLATAVTLMPIQQIGFDAAILFSDILILSLSMGLSLEFIEGSGPVVSPQIQNKGDILRLKNEIEQLGFVKQTIVNLKKELKVPLIGFCGGPFTVASYLIGDLKKTKKWIYEDPDSFELLLDKISDLSCQYLQSQIDAGVDAIQIFDSWAGFLSEDLLKRFSFNFIKKICAKITKVPIIIFMRNSCFYAKELSSLGCKAISCDWFLDLSHIRKQVGNQVALQGNFDPDFLYGSKEKILEMTLDLQHKMKGDKGWIVNLGHGIKPDTDVEKVKWFVQIIQQEK